MKNTEIKRTRLACMHFTDLLMTSDKKLYQSYQDKSFVQYCNEQSVYMLLSTNNSFMKKLSRQKSYVNIGMGAGFLEYLAINNGFNVEGVDLSFSSPKGSKQCHFKSFRKTLDVFPKYWMREFEDFEIIDCHKRYDAATFVRFGPFQSSQTKEALDTFFETMSKYTNEILICDLIVHEDILGYIKQRGATLEKGIYKFII